MEENNNIATKEQERYFKLVESIKKREQKKNYNELYIYELYSIYVLWYIMFLFF